ncbi:MAG TPA: hypothetical protein VFG74_02240 [Miltoncostaeaceae bacterium]|nr:hypothetical protein [Miltoncostaeaceae bacterium]
MERPAPIRPADALPDVEVDWAALPDGWQTRSVRARYRDEDRAMYANRIRAQVAEGLADPGLLRFADDLAGKSR